MKSKIIRMWLTTYKRIRKEFPGIRGETAGEYFDRLSRELNNG